MSVLVVNLELNTHRLSKHFPHQLCEAGKDTLCSVTLLCSKSVLLSADERGVGRRCFTGLVSVTHPRENPCFRVREEGAVATHHPAVSPSPAPPRGAPRPRRNGLLTNRWFAFHGSWNTEIRF